MCVCVTLPCKEPGCLFLKVDLPFEIRFYSEILGHVLLLSLVFPVKFTYHIF